MAITTYICARAHGKPMTAVPVFLVRAFHHGAILVNTKAGIRAPKDLEGKKVGVNRGYTVTTGVWARSMLQEEHGVDSGKITWVLSGDEHVAEYRPPSNVVPIEKGKKMADMLASGELAAAIGVEIDAGRQAADPERARTPGLAALRERGHYPINHLVVIKDELLAEHPDLAADVFNAFAESKRALRRALRRADREADRGRQGAPAGDGDHRRSAALRHRAEPPGARGADRPRADAGHHHQAGDRGGAVRAGHVHGSGGVSHGRPVDSPLAQRTQIGASLTRLSYAEEAVNIQASKKPQVAIMNAVHDLPVLVARDKGFFKDEGLDIEFVTTPGMAQVTTSHFVKFDSVFDRPLDSVYNDGGIDQYRMCEWGIMKRAVEAERRRPARAQDRGARRLDVEVRHRGRRATPRSTSPRCSRTRRSR